MSCLFYVYGDIVCFIFRTQAFCGVVMDGSYNSAILRWHGTSAKGYHKLVALVGVCKDNRLPAFIRLLIVSFLRITPLAVDNSRHPLFFWHFSDSVDDMLVVREQRENRYYCCVRMYMCMRYGYAMQFGGFRLWAESPW